MPLRQSSTLLEDLSSRKTHKPSEKVRSRFIYKLYIFIGLDNSSLFSCVALLLLYVSVCLACELFLQLKTGVSYLVCVLATWIGFRQLTITLTPQSLILHPKLMIHPNTQKSTRSSYKNNKSKVFLPPESNPHVTFSYNLRQAWFL